MQSRVPDYWKKPLWSVLIVLLLSVLIFYDTWATIVTTWAGTKTYNHGFVVAPISLWLIWSRWESYRGLRPSVSWLGLLPIAAFGFVWLIADLSHVLVLKQFAVVGMLASGFWVVIGNQVAANILFPLFFLFFMVPVGDQLIAPLMEFTATFAVNMLRMTGLSVYREGTFFTLTSGNWSVVEACSGINYLIASLTLGFVFAYLNYSSYWKRALFMVLSGLVPIIANGFRAYMIVMIGHLSGMKLAVGVDHIIYGGLFFGLVMLLLFYLGSFWREPILVPAVIESEPEANSASKQANWPALVLIGLGFLVWPQSAAWLNNQQTSGVLPDYLVNMQVPGWHEVPTPRWGWAPKYKGVVAQKTDYYSDGSRVIGIYLASFGKEEQGAELVNSLNVLINSDISGHWRKIDSFALALGSFTADGAVLNHDDLDLLVIEWFQVGNKSTANAYLAKYYQLIKRLTGDNAPETKVVVWTETIHDNHMPARDALQIFMREWFSQQNNPLPH